MHWPFLRSTWLFPQPKSLTSLKTIWITVSPGPTLLLSPGITRLPTFSGTVPASDHSPSLGNLPAVCFPLCVYLHSDFKDPGLSWHGSGFPALGGEGAAKLQSLTRLSSKAPLAAAIPSGTASAVVYGTGPRDLPIGLQKLLNIHF